MRCKNCGWNNPDSATRCEKCNRPLISDSVSSNYSQPAQRAYTPMPGADLGANKATRFDANMAAGIQSPVTQPVQASSQPVVPQPASQPAHAEDNRATRMYAAPQAATGEEDMDPGNCPSCGYPLSPGSTVCPMCGASVGGKDDKPAFEVKLTCMDDEAHVTISIGSGTQLSLQPGDIILIAGLRYKVNE